jgi:transcriptional regulator with XRE-family HTH domain
MTLRDRLREELSRRQRRNPRYSRRALARSIGVGHSVVSRLLAGSKRVTPRIIRDIARGLGASERDIVEFLQAEREQLIVTCAADRAFHADCRWLACRSGLSVDDVNRTLFTLISGGQLRLVAADRWRVVPKARHASQRAVHVG